MERGGKQQKGRNLGQGKENFECDTWKFWLFELTGMSGKKAITLVRLNFK